MTPKLFGMVFIANSFISILLYPPRLCGLLRWYASKHCLEAEIVNIDKLEEVFWIISDVNAKQYVVLSSVCWWIFYFFLLVFLKYSHK